jgi:hypothetical protein
LFVGIISTASLIFSGDSGTEQNLVINQIERGTERISIREIETLSASNNFSFTSKNALK